MTDPSRFCDRVTGRVNLSHPISCEGACELTQSQCVGAKNVCANGTISRGGGGWGMLPGAFLKLDS